MEYLLKTPPLDLVPVPEFYSLQLKNTISNTREHQALLKRITGTIEWDLDHDDDLEPFDIDTEAYLESPEGTVWNYLDDMFYQIAPEEDRLSFNDKREKRHRNPSTLALKARLIAYCEWANRYEFEARLDEGYPLLTSFSCDEVAGMPASPLRRLLTSRYTKDALVSVWQISRVPRTYGFDFDPNETATDRNVVMAIFDK